MDFKRNIVVNQKTLEYTHKKYRRSKCIRVIVHHDGMVVATSPFWVRVGEVDEFVRARAPWIVRQIESFRSKNNTYHLSGSVEEYEKFREDARRFIEERVEILNRTYGYSVKSISIRNQKTRWGSCSSAGQLSFHYRLYLLPEYLADYVIVHEICHLREMNHSKEFWALVSRAIPQYQKCRQLLRKVK